MRLLRACAITTLLAWAIPAQDGAELLGRWRSVETSKGGIGATYEFHPGGKIDISPGAIVESRYQLQDKTLVLKTGAEPEQRLTIGWTPDGRLKLGPAANQQEVLTRFGDAPAAASDRLQGEWRGERNMGGNRVAVRWIFSRTADQTDGKVLLIVAFKTEKGNYTVASGGIGVSTPGGRPWQARYKVQDGILVVTRLDGPVYKFSRY